MPEPVLERALAQALGQALGVERLELGAWRTLGGGCISPAAVVATSAGPFFVKWNATGPADLFTCEAAGLRALERAGSGLKVPRVWVARETGPECPGFIVLEQLETRPASADDEEQLGRGLAELHRQTAPAFGFDSLSYCGTTRQANDWCPAWTEFYAERRLRPLLEALERARQLGPAERCVYERLIARLPELLPQASLPALVHGDLWSGNVLFSTSGPALVDPACAYAEREFEFGIATLFGGLGPRALAAYHESFPLPAGWRERNPLYQLYHLLNHALLFGGGYGAQALAIARRYV